MRRLLVPVEIFAGDYPNTLYTASTSSPVPGEVVSYISEWILWLTDHFFRCNAGFRKTVRSASLHGNKEVRRLCEITLKRRIEFADRFQTIATV